MDFFLPLFLPLLELSVNVVACLCETRVRPFPCNRRGWILETSNIQIFQIARELKKVTSNIMLGSCITFYFLGKSAQSMLRAVKFVKEVKYCLTSFTLDKPGTAPLH